MTRTATDHPDLLPIEDLLAPPARTRATISPDGTRVAFLAPWRHRLNVWVADAPDPAAIEDARPVTADATRSILSYLWASPRWILYTQDTGGDENAHVYRVDVDAPDAPAVDLTPYPGGRVFSHALLPSRPGTLVVSIHRPPGVDRPLHDRHRHR